MSIFADGDERQRLALLYFLRVAGTELTNDQICCEFEKNGWGDYFSLQVAISELCESRLLGTCTLPDGVGYFLTEKGNCALEEFYKRLPNSFRCEMDEYAARNRRSYIAAHQNVAGYEKLGENEYLVTCAVVEKGKEIFSVNLTVVSAEHARRAVERWMDAAPGLYAMAVEKLLSDS